MVATGVGSCAGGVSFFSEGILTACAIGSGVLLTTPCWASIAPNDVCVGELVVPEAGASMSKNFFKDVEFVGYAVKIKIVFNTQNIFFTDNERFSIL